MTARGIYLEVKDFLGCTEGVAELSITSFYYMHLSPGRGLFIIGRDNNSSLCKAICGGVQEGKIALSKSSQSTLGVGIGDCVHVFAGSFPLIKGKLIDMWKADPLLKQLHGDADMHMKMNRTSSGRLFVLRNFEDKQISLNEKWFHSKIVIPPLPNLENLQTQSTRASSSRVPDTKKMRVKVRKLNGKRVNVEICSDKPVSDIIIRVFRYSSQEVRLYYDKLELDPGLSLDLQGVPNGAELYGEKTITLHCRTSKGRVNLVVTGVDSIPKVKMNIVLAAGLDCSMQYNLLWRNNVLTEKYNVGYLALDEHCDLSLRRICSKMPQEQISQPQAIMKAVVSMILPDTPVITTNLSSEELRDQGFGRHILDPITYYKMLLGRGKVSESEKEASSDPHIIKIGFEIFNYGMLSMTIDDRETVLKAKQKLAKDIKIEESNQKMIYCGQPLDSERTLESYDIQNGDIVTLYCTGSNSYLYLPLEYFDSAGDFDFTDYIPPSEKEKRGGYDYFPPVGWKRIGLKVTGKFENDIWLGNSNQSGEWIVSYHGGVPQVVQKIAKDGYNIKDKGKEIYKEGVTTASHVEEAQKLAIPFTWEGQNYQIAFMNRINPDTVIKTKDQNPDRPDWYVTKSDKDIRLYGLLIRAVEPDQAPQPGLSQGNV